MKLKRLTHKAVSGRFLFLVISILFAVHVGPAASASEPEAITVVIGGEPDLLDPGEIADTWPGQIAKQTIIETLTERDFKDGTVVPLLATSWKMIDESTWQFTLRKGVKFHDGADFNVEAVIFSIKRFYDPILRSGDKDQFFSDIKIDPKALDSHTIELRTNTFQPLLPTILSTMGICSPKTPMKTTRHPIGTGPYKFVRWDAGMQVVTERFDGYWGPQPQVKKVTYIWRKESSVRASMVLVGEADFAPEIARQDATRTDMDFSWLNADTSYLRIQTDTTPLNDRRVRLALNLATDREGMRGTILSKDVVLATQLVIPSTFGYNPDIKPYPYDPKRAKQLLDEARKDGVKVDKEILLLDRIGVYPGSAELMEAILNMYKAVGFNMKLKSMEKGAMRPYENQPFPKDAGPYIVHKTHDNDKGDAAFTVFYKYGSTGSQSATFDKVLDDLVAKAQVSMGENRRSLWQAAFKRIQEDIISDVMLYHMVSYSRIGKRIHFDPSWMRLSEIPVKLITFK